MEKFLIQRFDFFCSLVLRLWRAKKEGEGKKKGKRGRKRGREEEKRGKEQEKREGKRVVSKVLGKVFKNVMS